MTNSDFFEYVTPQELWCRRLIENHAEEAAAKVASILASTTRDANGCMVTNTTLPAKVRFRGGQDRAYRFVFCVVNAYPAAPSEVVRHRCNNRLCVNPEHLELGTRGDNNEDDRRFRARGVDFDLL